MLVRLTFAIWQRQEAAFRRATTRREARAYYEKAVAVDPAVAESLAHLGDGAPGGRR